MTNLSVCEKLALEEVFECLTDKSYKRFSLVNKRYFAYKMMRFYISTKRFLHVRR
ncbi:MAG: hypothetical protein J0647_05920 [Campylobacteraceae bacterium]|nr:hypothetical protein [Campylobacteraceae bacterium]